MFHVHPQNRVPEPSPLILAGESVDSRCDPAGLHLTSWTCPVLTICIFAVYLEIKGLYPFRYRDLTVGLWAGGGWFKEGARPWLYLASFARFWSQRSVRSWSGRLAPAPPARPREFKSSTTRR